MCHGNNYPLHMEIEFQINFIHDCIVPSDYCYNQVISQRCDM